ncbi:helix-turn-helix transcriptional regulator [uncultured Treponema sp.]|uniref:helix-turn-helix domain-containing protein n=1 Tax=uncultured Treponema sp. TaxID=162155 RepID=UPI0025EA64E0|nr:helix-turn-helix transcriptional regulator [uncultured Treponema sp.]
MLQFWTNVKEELEYNLITQKELASAIGISYNTLQSWITKDRLPDAEQALKIAKQLNTSIEYLVTGKSEEQKGIKTNLQNMIPKLNRLSNENLELIDVIAGRLK